MAWNIYPTEAPVGNWYGYDANCMREAQLTSSWGGIVKCSPLASFRHSGLAFTQGAGTTVDIPVGICVIAGYVVEIDTPENLGGMSDNTTYYIWATIIKTGDIVTSGAYIANNGAEPANPAVCLGKVVFASGVGTIMISASKPRAVTGSVDYHIGTYDVFLGFQPSALIATIHSITATYANLYPGWITTFGFQVPAQKQIDNYIALA